MNGKVILCLLIVACAVGAYVQMTAGPAPLETLLKTAGAAPGYAHGDIQMIEPGPSVERFCEPGRITVFAFVSDSCPGCRKIRGHVQDHARQRPDVAIRLIDVGYRWRSDDCRARYGVNIYSVPHVLIYDAEGNLLAADDGRDKDGLELLYDWMNAEPRKQR